MDDALDQEAITMYPNPTDSEVRFKNIVQSYEASIFNMLGQRVKTDFIDGTNNAIDVSNLSNGAYFIRLNEGLVFRFIKR